MSFFNIGMKKILQHNTNKFWSKVISLSKQSGTSCKKPETNVATKRITNCND